MDDNTLKLINIRFGKLEKRQDRHGDRLANYEKMNAVLEEKTINLGVIVDTLSDGLKDSVIATNNLTSTLNNYVDEQQKERIAKLEARPREKKESFFKWAGLTLAIGTILWQSLSAAVDDTKNHVKTQQEAIHARFDSLVIVIERNHNKP